jgi:aspartyl protease family protein
MSSHEPSRMLKIVTVWLLLGLIVFVGMQAWLRQQRQAQFHHSEGRIELRRAGDGHYHWPGTFNGRTVDFLVDTGATGTAIPASLAGELGLPLGDEVRSNTAGGIVRGRLSRADITLQGGVRAERLAVMTLPALDSPLLGMNVMGRLQWRQRDGVLIVDLAGDPH